MWNTSKLIDLILSYQNGSGFALDHSIAADTDITAMTITALSQHLSVTGVLDAVNASLSFLSSKQTASGGFIASGNTQESSESISQVIIALSSLKLDAVTDTRFIKNGKSLIDNLISYKTSEGGFSHINDGSGTDIVATQQGLLALEAYNRFLSNKTYVYDLTDVSPATTSVPTATASISNPKTGSQDMTPNILIGVVMLIIIFIPRRKIETED